MSDGEEKRLSREDCHFVTLPVIPDTDMSAGFCPEFIVWSLAPVPPAEVWLTVMETELLVAVVGLAHEALDVITQETMSPFANPEFEYVAEFVPTFDPFNFH